MARDACEATPEQREGAGLHTAPPGLRRGEALCRHCHTSPTGRQEISRPGIYIHYNTGDIYILLYPMRGWNAHVVVVEQVHRVLHRACGVHARAKMCAAMAEVQGKSDLFLCGKST